MSFYGPDATVWLRVQDGVTLAARMAGHLVPASVSMVRLQADGEVMAFPANPLPA